MPWQSLLHCWVSKAGRLTFSLQNQATFKFRCLLVFVAYCDTGRGKGLALWPSLFTRHSVVVNLWNVCRDGFQREINFLIFFFVGCMRQRVFQPDLQETSRSSHCSEACLGPSCKMPDAGCGFSTRTVWLFLAMFPFFCLACCLIGIAPWHSGFAHWLWKCLRLCPDVLHSQELWAQILDPESCQQLATDTHFSCLIWPTCTWNATSCSWLCISTLSTVDWIVLQIFFKPFVTEVTIPCSCFLPYPSISWQAWHVWCLFLWPLRLLWLTSWCNWIGYLVIFVAAPLLCTSGFGFAVIMAVMKVMKKPASLKPPKKRLGKAVLRCSVHHAHYCFGIPFLGFTGKALVHWACLMFCCQSWRSTKLCPSSEDSHGLTQVSRSNCFVGSITPVENDSVIGLELWLSCLQLSLRTSHLSKWVSCERLGCPRCADLETWLWFVALRDLIIMLISHGLSNARLRIREHIDYTAARLHTTARFLRTLGFVSCPVRHTVWLHDLLGGRTSIRYPVQWWRFLVWRFLVWRFLYSVWLLFVSQVLRDLSQQAWQIKGWSRWEG